MPDLILIDTKNGGDLIKSGNDLVFTEGYASLVYLSLFGGSNWWGNVLMDDVSAKYECRTGALLSQVSLNSSGRIAIENAVRADLQYIPTQQLTVSVTIGSDTEASIRISIDAEVFIINMNPPSIENPYWRLNYTGIFTRQFTEQFS